MIKYCASIGFQSIPVQAGEIKNLPAVSSTRLVLLLIQAIASVGVENTTIYLS